MGNNIYYLLRHGTTRSNKKKVLIGVVDDGLSDEGVNESLVLRQVIADRQIYFDRVISSDLRRSYDTVQLALNVKNPVVVHEGYQTENDNSGNVHPFLVDSTGETLFDGKIESDFRLRERDYGHLAGHSIFRVKEKFIHLYNGRDPVTHPDIVPEGGESLRVKYDQAKNLVDELEAENEVRYLLSGHGGSLGMVSLALIGQTLDDILVDEHVDLSLLRPPHSKLMVYESKISGYEATEVIG